MPIAPAELNCRSEMSTPTCRSCAKSYLLPIDDYGNCMRFCKPDGERQQHAGIVCLKYEREPGADEPEDVGGNQ